MEQSPIMQGKRITVYVNGDPFMKGKQVTMNQHQFPEFDRFCTFLTERVPNRTGGCYRHLYTPNGTEISSLHQIEAGNEYVVSQNRFKRISYKDIPEKARASFNTRKKRESRTVGQRYTPVQHANSEQYRRKSGRAHQLGKNCHGMFLKVHINRQIGPAHTVAIRPSLVNDMSRILWELENSLEIRCIKRVFRIDSEGYGGERCFTEIQTVEELHPAEHLLVVPEGSRPEFRPYPMMGMKDITVKTSPRSDLIGQNYYRKNDKDRYRHNKSLNRHQPLPSIGSSKQSDSRSPFSNTGSQGRRRNNQKSRTRQVDYDKDHNSGVYHAKKQNNARGSQQVNDTRDTRTEKPIDQMEAEIVEEERVNEDAGMHHNDEFGDDSFNRNGYDSNTPGVQNRDMRSSTPVSRGESRRKQQQKENEAAVKIQAGARGYKTRKEFRAKKESMQREKDERNQQQQDDRRRQEEEDDYRRREDEAQQNGQEKSRDEDYAASKIQASFKGYKTRKDLKTKQQGQK